MIVGLRDRGAPLSDGTLSAADGDVGDGGANDAGAVGANDADAAVSDGLCPLKRINKVRLKQLKIGNNLLKFGR